MTIHLEFAPEIQKTLNYERYHYPVPRVQQRMEVVWLKSHGLPHRQIAQLSGVCDNTMRHYFRLYQSEGIERLKQVQWVGPVSALAGEAKTLEAHFQAHPPASVKQGQHEIEQLTGIKHGRSQIRAFVEICPPRVTGLDLLRGIHRFQSGYHDLLGANPYQTQGRFRFAAYPEFPAVQKSAIPCRVKYITHATPNKRPWKSNHWARGHRSSP